MIIVIKGYYGRFNLGDEKMVEIFTRKLSNMFPHATLNFFNASPKFYYEKHSLNTPSPLETGRRFNLVREIRKLFIVLKSDLFILGGGTVITDKHSNLHLIQNLMYFLLRKIFRKKSMIISVGATRLNTKLAKFCVRKFINCADLVTIRDEWSFKYLTEYISTKGNIVQTEDMVWLSIDQTNFPNPKGDSKAKIGLCVLPYNKATFDNSSADIELGDSLLDELKKLLNKNPNIEYHFIPIQYGLDNNLDYEYSLALSKKIDSIVHLPKCEEDKIALLGQMDIVVSMRLHALMYAYSAGSSIVAISHNPKIESFMKAISLEDNCLELQNISNLSKMLEYAIEEDRKVDCEKIHENVRRKKILAEMNFDLISSCFYEGLNE